jgi:hypothetical protein
MFASKKLVLPRSWRIRHSTAKNTMIAFRVNVRVFRWTQPCAVKPVRVLNMLRVAKARQEAKPVLTTPCAKARLFVWNMCSSSTDQNDEAIVNQVVAVQIMNGHVA